MRTLFGKIFLTFWLIILLTILITVVVLNLSRPEFSQLPPFISKSVVQAEKAYQRSGVNGLKQWAEHINIKLHPSSVYVLSQNQQDILDRPIDSRVVTVAALLSEERKSDGQRFGRKVVLGYYLTGAEGKSYKIVFDKPLRKKEFLRHLLRNLWLVLIIGLLFAGTICYLLAKNLTAPIKALQQASNSLAEGDLDVHISEKFTHRKDEIADLAKDFSHMAKQLKHVYSHQNRLIHDMSHELRAPISRMQVALALLEGNDDLTDPSSIEMLARLNQEINQFELIIKQTLSLPLFDQEHCELDQTQDLNATLIQLIEDKRFESQSDLLVNYQPSKQPLWVNTRENWLETLFRNILDNAIQYRTDMSSIDITINEHLEYYQVTIMNLGEGVPAEYLKDIFEAFYRADKARTPGSTNLGLGLSMVKKLVFMMKGHVKAENIDDESNHRLGFKVVIELPKKE